MKQKYDKPRFGGYIKKQERNLSENALANLTNK